MFSRTAIAIVSLATAMAIPTQAQLNDASGISFASSERGIPLADCTDFDYQQPLDAVNFNTARTSDEEVPQVVAEAIVSGGVITPFAGGDTTALRVWAIDAEFNQGFVGACTEDQAALTGFNVNFYSDNAGVPDPVPSFSTTATVDSIVDTAVAFAFTTIFEYNLTLDMPAPEGYEWIEIIRQTGESTVGGNQCLWLWVDEIAVGTYDDQAAQNGALVPTDQTICVQAAPAPPVTEVPINLPALLTLVGLLGLAAVVVIRRVS